MSQFGGRRGAPWAPRPSPRSVWKRIRTDPAASALNARSLLEHLPCEGGVCPFGSGSRSSGLHVLGFPPQAFCFCKQPYHESLQWLVHCRRTSCGQACLQLMVVSVATNKDGSVR